MAGARFDNTWDNINCILLMFIYVDQGRSSNTRAGIP